ncbi:MAG: M56 family metallopeptidase, partial [Planctomycetota bacterium]
MTGQTFLQNGFLWSCLWQSTLCIGAGLILSLIFRRRPARGHRLLLLGMIAALLVPIISATVRHFELGLFVADPAVIGADSPGRVISEPAGDYRAANSDPIAESGLSAGSVEECATSTLMAWVGHLTIPWRQLVLWAWPIGSMILALRLIWSFVLGFRLVAGGKPVSCQRIQGAARIARARLGLAGDVGVCSSERVRCPVIWCWGRNPVLLVPSSSQQADKDIDWVSVVCHELAHWKRLDHIAGLLTELIVCVFAWNPLAWWARRRLLRLSEQACDDWV